MVFQGDNVGLGSVSPCMEAATSARHILSLLDDTNGELITVSGVLLLVAVVWLRDNLVIVRGSSNDIRTKQNKV